MSAIIHKHKHGPWPPHPDMRIGDIVTISGVAYGPQYGKHGLTTRCKPGDETPMVIIENGFSQLDEAPRSRVMQRKKCANEPKQYGHRSGGAGERFQPD